MQTMEHVPEDETDGLYKERQMVYTCIVHTQELAVRRLWMDTHMDVTWTLNMDYTITRLCVHTYIVSCELVS